MLKHRQEGLLTLHAILVVGLISLLYFAFRTILDLTMWIILVEEANSLLYFSAVFCGMLLGLPCYQPRAHKLANLSFTETAQLTKQQILRVGLVVFAVVFATKDAAISRAFISGFLILTTLTLLLANYALPRLICRFIFAPAAVRTLIVGDQREAERLREWAREQSTIGVEPVGILTDEEAVPGSTSLPILGKHSDLDKILGNHSIALVILIKGALTPEQTRDLLQKAQHYGCRVRIYNNYEKEFGHPVIIDHEGPYTFFTLDNEPLENPINRLVKRVLDVAVALPVVAFVLPPLTLAVWLFQRKQAPGPIFYQQPRAGLTQATFQILKFRTMYAGNTAVSKQATANDDRIYPFGRFLRKTSLDEIPQFINVLIGEMSVAGPRPHLREHDEIFRTAFNTYHTRHFVKPGITGLAQCKGYRGEILNDELLRRRIDFDIMYINRWSILLDLQIILLTFKQVLFPPKSAY